MLVQNVKFESISVNDPLHSFTSLPTGGEKQKSPIRCQGCELSLDCTSIGAFFCALHSGRRVYAPSVSDGYFASAPRPSSVCGEVANGACSNGLVIRSLSDTRANDGKNGGSL